MLKGEQPGDVDKRIGTKYVQARACISSFARPSDFSKET